MAMRHLLLACACAAIGVASIRVPVSAEPAAPCESLNAAVDAGREVEEIASSFSTTQARVSACARLASKRARHDERRRRLHAARSDRDLPFHP
jgi:hypothetical protein